MFELVDLPFLAPSDASPKRARSFVVDSFKPSLRSWPSGRLVRVTRIWLCPFKHCPLSEGIGELSEPFRSLHTSQRRLLVHSYIIPLEGCFLLHFFIPHHSSFTTPSCARSNFKRLQHQSISVTACLLNNLQPRSPLQRPEQPNAL
jgi:hypothetical protein